MLRSYDDLCSILCTVLCGRYCVIQHSCYNTHQTMIITSHSLEEYSQCNVTRQRHSRITASSWRLWLRPDFHPISCAVCRWRVKMFTVHLLTCFHRCATIDEDKCLAVESFIIELLQLDVSLWWDLIFSSSMWRVSRITETTCCSECYNTTRALAI